MSMSTFEQSGVRWSIAYGRYGLRKPTFCGPGWRARDVQFCSDNAWSAHLCYPLEGSMRADARRDPHHSELRSQLN
jgi:hypothetical protein